MAAVLDALWPYLKKLIMDMVTEEVFMLLGVSGEITKLHDNMEGLCVFFADAERRRITDRAVQRWVSRLRNVIYDATDIIELCQLNADERMVSRLENKVPGCFQLLLFCQRNPSFAHDMGSRIRQLNQRLEYIRMEASEYRFNIGLGSYQELMASFELSRYNNRTTQEFNELAVVGQQIEEDTKELAQMLITTDGNHDFKVMSIIGMPGTGKTTLAQKIFNEPTIQEHFGRKIWLSVTDHFGESELLRSAITQACGDHGGEDGKVILTEKLIHILSVAGRFLLVMDDVWSHEAWNNVLSVPVRIASRKQPGSWVIVTTRIAHIPQQMQAPLHQHRVRLLDEDDAWCLLKKQLSPNLQAAVINDLKDTGMEILEVCDGLPLAIKVVGELLSMRSPTKSEWERILNNFAWSVAGLPQELDNRLYISYEDLSPQLKQCFLYCSLFPKGQKIVQRTITEMWVSEGFVTTSSRERFNSYDNESEVAIEYYQELIKRNFIEPTEKYSLTGYACSIHNVVRSFAQYMAREEALVVQRTQQIEGIIGAGGQSNLLRRLSIESTESIPVEWAALQKLVSLRVLIINCKINFKPGDSLSSFSSLRVLHIVRLSDSDRLLSSLCQLKHLRYLYLYDSDISSLPDDINRMKFLQYIGVVNCERFVHLPGNIVELRNLRSLDLVGTNVHAIPKGFGELTNLRSLFGFPVHTDDIDESWWCSLQELEPLFQLRSLMLEGVEKVDASHSAEMAMISSKRHLSSLQLNYSGSTTRSSNVSSLEEQQLIQEEVYEHLCPPSGLETLLMEGYIGRQLPNWMSMPMALSFKSMRYMSLQNLASCTHLPDGLGQMPSLERLEINKAPLIRHVGPEFLHHGHLGYAFPRLQELVLEGMVEWREWEWNDMQAMPALEVLLVKRCKLRSFPPGLSYHARALRRLVITDALLLESLENFSSLVELEICLSPELTRIVGTPRLQKLTIRICPKLRVFWDMPGLTSLVVEDYEMKTLPGYLLAIRPLYLTLDCSKKLLKSIAMGQDGPEWNKISHIHHVRANAEAGGYQRKCCVLYTREPYSLVVNTLLDDSEENLTDDDLVRNDIPSGSKENLSDNEFAGSDIPSGSSAGEDLLNNNDSELVGIESPREEIIKMLMHGQALGNQQPQVVCICGIGGSGKTCVAKAVYRHIANRFECKAFISVSQRRADDKSIIQNIFDQVGCPYPSLEECVSHQQLIGTLKGFLQDKRYLIVVDDICDVSVWEMIKPALLIDNNHRSGIIATTYKVVVAGSIGGVYRLPLLSDDDSKILFYRKTYFQTENGCFSEYRESTKRILNKCGGLPLAINTFASLLPNDYLVSPEVWRKVADYIASGSFQFDDRVKHMSIILSRSYDDGLPQCLRTCFLYLCTFPEDYVIRRDSLVKRWLSEDLIGGIDDGQNLLELGERYFYDLLDTGMIQPIEYDYDGKALACRVHGLMIDLIFSNAKSEETIKHFQQRSLSISCADSKQDREPENISLFAGFRTIHPASLKEYLRNNKNLRVLELGGSLGEQHIDENIWSLHQLRYLVLESTKITAIPSELGKLRFLQTLDLRKTSVHELPSTFVGLKQLRCLLVNRSTKVPAGISNLQALEEVQDIDIIKSPDIKEGICNLPVLSVLMIASSSWEWDESSSKHLPETLCKLSTTKLKHLSICTSCPLEFKPDDIPKVFQNIEKLEISICMFDTVPNWIDDKLKKLSSLSIEVYLLEKDGLKLLASLPALHFLSLTTKKTEQGRPNAEKTPEETPTAKTTTQKGRPNANTSTLEKGLTAQEGLEAKVDTDKLVVPIEGFGKLKTFHLFSRAIGIEFQQGSMKNLETLKLSFQALYAMDDFSIGMDNLSSLKYLQVEIICFSAREEVVKKAEDAIRSKIRGSPKQPSPALEIRRSAEEYMIKLEAMVEEEQRVLEEERRVLEEERRVLEEERRDKIRASWGFPTASVQKDKQKKKNARAEDTAAG